MTTLKSTSARASLRHRPVEQRHAVDDADAGRATGVRMGNDE
jgi:hypothetical protein